MNNDDYGTVNQYIAQMNLPIFGILKVQSIPVQQKQTSGVT